MPGLDYTMGQIPGGSTRRTYGTAHWDGSEWTANLGGNLVSCRWLDPIQPFQGAPLVVDVSDDGRGQSSALVVGMYTFQPRPSTGTVSDILPAGPAIRIVFTGEDGKSYTTDRFVGSYNIGDPVYVTWDAAKPTVLGKIQTSAPPPDQPLPPPPTAVQTGFEVIPATASDTWGVGGWGRWATSQNGGEDVYSGSWGGVTTSGAWFYGAPRPALQGKTVTKVLFRLPARLGVGGYNSAATIHLYAHASQGRPGGDVARVAGPFDVSIPAGYTPGTVLTAGEPPGYVSLPLNFASALVNGGGISISGEPYVGFKSRLADPEAGKLIMDWRL